MEVKADGKTDSQARLDMLQQLLRLGVASTQDELCRALRQKKFHVTQSTISRDLRRIGAVKTLNSDGEVIYALASVGSVNLPLPVSHSLGHLLVDMKANDSMIVVHTSPGSASLVARHLDSLRGSLGIMGTIAGDDTIFIAPESKRQVAAIMKRIRDEF